MLLIQGRRTEFIHIFLVEELVDCECADTVRAALVHPQVLKEVPADELAHSTLAVSHSGRVVFTGTSFGTVRAIKYPLPIQKEWISYHAHCGAVTKVGLSTVNVQCKQASAHNRNLRVDILDLKLICH